MEAVIERIADPGTTHVDLEGHEFGDYAICQLARALPGSKIVVLNIRDNRISDASAMVLAEVLPRTQIEELDISYSNIRKKGALAMAKAIPRSKLTEIYLFISGERDYGASILRPALFSLDCNLVRGALGIIQIKDMTIRPRTIKQRVLVLLSARHQPCAMSKVPVELIRSMGALMQ